MIEADFNASIRASLDFIERARLGELTINLSSLRVSPEFNEVALDRNMAYYTIYRTGLRLSHFNLQLNDFSFFQYSWQNTSSWRLAYYPNPWLTGVPNSLDRLEELKEMLSAGAINTEEFFDEVSESFDLFQSVPMLRYEYSESQYRPIQHPASHFHIGSFGEDRWALRRNLSPKSFTMLVVRMFFPTNWAESSSFYNPAANPCLEAELNSSLHDDGTSTNFSADEARSFHFSALQ